MSVWPPAPPPVADTVIHFIGEDPETITPACGETNARIVTSDKHTVGCGECLKIMI